MASNMDKITDAIIEKLEQGEIPWVKPWRESGLAKNWSTGREYSGMNMLFLEPGKEYATFNQITAAGGKIKKGAKSKVIHYFSPEQREITKINEKGISETLIQKTFVYKKFNVFEVGKDTEGLNLKWQNKVQEKFDPAKEMDSIISKYKNPPQIVHSGNEAYYSPSKDLISLPTPEAFKTTEAYYSTLAHELVHSTGSEKRLNRLDGAKFGSPSYAKEELVAEIGSAFLLNEAGIKKDIDNTAAYIQSWLKTLKNDKSILMTAIPKAMTAVNHITGREREKTKTLENKIEPIKKEVDLELPKAQDIKKDIPITKKKEPTKVLESKIKPSKKEIEPPKSKSQSIKKDSPTTPKKEPAKKSAWAKKLDKEKEASLER